MNKKLEKFMSNNKPLGSSSELEPYREEILILQKNKYTQQQISQYLKESYDLKISRQAISFFLRIKKNDNKIKNEVNVFKEENSQKANEKVEKSVEINQDKLKDFLSIWERKK